jgi:hypothetical protein
MRHLLGFGGLRDDCSMLVAIEQIMPNTWLLASVLPSSRSEIGTAAVIDFAGNAPRSSR